jgi:Tol biopolymer transport system component
VRAFRSVAALILPAACVAHLHAQAAPAPGAAATNETIAIRTSEGTFLAFDIARDGRIVMDLLGEIREIPAAGGDAQRLTDAVRDTAEDLDPSYAPDGRRIVFRGERRGRTGLWLLEPGAAAPRQLTQLANPDGQDGSAAWSPDGKTIAFARMLPPDGAHPRWRSAIALIAATGGDSARLLRIDSLPTPHARDPAWAPDGRRLAFVAQSARAPRGGRLWIVDAAGGTAAPLSPEGVEALAPAFAPDGRRLAFLAPDSAGRTQVWVQDATAPGAAPARLTAHGDVAATRVRWTGGGRAIAYSADGRLWTISATGGAPKEIRFTAELTIERQKQSLPAAHFPEPGRAEPVRGFTGLALSRDAQRIGMLALGKLWVMPAEGGTPRAVADVPPTARTVAWSADGATIAWSAGRAEEEDLFATDVASGATRQVTALPGREVFPAFSPDGRHLAFVHGAPDGTARLRVIPAAARDLADDSRAATLDSLDLAWTASTADVPAWSPASDGLLRIAGGWGAGPTSAVLARLPGGRRTIAGVPDSPLYLQWLDGALVHVRHARLWRTPFDSAGPTAPSIPLGDDPAMYLSAAADGTLLYLSDGGLRLRAPDGRERRLGWPLSFTPPVPPPLLIRNARVIDGSGAPATAQRDILVEQGRIIRIEPAGALRAAGDAPAADTLDAAGGFVIPGLMDLHAHLYVPALLPAFLYFGVTTVRDQGSPIGPLAAWAEGSAAGAFAGPRVDYGGFQLYSDWAYDTEEGLGVEPEADTAHAARSVALAALLGAQHVKTRTFRRWDINARMVAEAHRRGLRATGHCAHLLPLVAAGMDAQEHAGFCGRRGDGRLYDDMVQLYRAAGIAVVPTVVYSAFAERLTGPELLGRDAELAPFLPAKEAFGWMLGLDPDGRRSVGRSAGVAREAALRLARAGVTIGTGTDIWQVPSAVHLELEELVAAGLTPLAAIRAATGDAARILGAADIGTIAVGKVADLVVLDADPVADIRTPRRIRAVVQGGRVVDRARIREAAVAR